MSKINTKNVAKYSAMISLILVLSKIIGFIREMLIAAKFGASIESDIFKTATTIPNLFYSCVAAGLVTSFIPSFSSFKNDKKKANLFFSNIFNVLFLICLILASIGILFAPQLTRLFVSGFEGEQLVKTYSMTRIAMPSIIFLALSGLQTGYLQSYGVFIQPALTSIVASFIMIIGILFIRKYGTIAAVLGFLFGTLAQVVFQWIFMKEYKYRFYFNFKDQNVKKMLLLSVPILLSSAVSQINSIVNSRYASNLAYGSISIIDYASKVSTIINQVFIVSITTILYPMLTEKFSSGIKKDFQELIIKSVNIVTIIAIPLIFGMIVLSTPLVKFLLEHGKFNSSDTAITALCLSYLAIGTFGYSLIDILGKVFFSTKDTVTPMINGFITVGLNIVLIFILVPKFGVSGLAIATTTSASIIALIMLIELKIKLKDINFSKFAVVLIKTLTAGLTMSIAVYFTHNYLNTLTYSEGNIILAIKLCIDAFIGAMVYAGMLLLLRVEELQSILSLKKRK